MKAMKGIQDLSFSSKELWSFINAAFYFHYPRIFGEKKEAAFSTYPNILSPHFGARAAEIIFSQWSAMRNAGDLGADEPFEILEVGGGNGVFMRDILAYIAKNSERSEARRSFFDGVRYTLGEWSPQLRHTQGQVQASLVSDYGYESKQIKVAEAQASTLLSSFSEKQFRFILTNELLDDMGRYILSKRGESLFVQCFQPFWSESASEALLAKVGGKKRLQTEAEHIQMGLDPYLKVGGKPKLWMRKERVLSLIDDPELATCLKWSDFELPVSGFPDVEDYLACFPSVRQYLMSEIGDAPVFINIEARRFIESCGRLLDKGFLMTIDYMEKVPEHTITYHPKKIGFGSRKGDQISVLGDAVGVSNPTSSVDATALSFFGEASGLDTLFYGPQHYLETVGIEEDGKPLSSIDATKNEADLMLFRYSPQNRFNFLIQKKSGTVANWQYNAISEQVGYTRGLLDLDRVHPKFKNDHFIAYLVAGYLMNGFVASEKKEPFSDFWERLERAPALLSYYDWEPNGAQVLTLLKRIVEEAFETELWNRLNQERRRFDSFECFDREVIHPFFEDCFRLKICSMNNASMAAEDPGMYLALIKELGVVADEASCRRLSNDYFAYLLKRHLYWFLR
jgi:SAM-dependent MidA family methyltransferase